MIAGTAFGAPKTAGDPLDQGAVVYPYFDDQVEPEPTFRQHMVQCFGLRGGPREAIQNDPVTGVGLIDALGDHADDNVVGHELARFHHLFRLLAQCGTGRHGCAEHVAR